MTPEQRRDIVNALLLAQLVAKKALPAPKNLDELSTWYDRYYEVLANIGFVIQETEFRHYEDEGKGFEGHEAVLEVAATFFGGAAPAALTVLKSVLAALSKVGDKQPWITLFNRESHSAGAARFQVSAVDLAGDGTLVMLGSFGLEATDDLTQVLFFKLHSNQVKIRYNASKVSINAQVLEAVRDQIAKKLAGIASEYIEGLPDL